MKLNGLTNNLKGNDQSLSNSYLSHIVELLRQEVDALEKKEAEVEQTVEGHIEEQKVVVNTETVNANSVVANKVNTTNIGDKILLANAIEMFTTLKVNGHTVITDEQFTGPFTYKGVVEELPETSTAGDVYIYNNVVYVSNGTTYNSFNIPLGTVSKTEYEEDKQEIIESIADLKEDVQELDENFTDYKTITDAVIESIENDITDLGSDLGNKVDKNVEDNKPYVRKNDEWVELSAAENTVPARVGDSYIYSDEERIEVGADRMDIISDDVYINGHKLPETNKFGLSKTTDVDTNYYYEMKYGRSPFTSSSSIRRAWVTWNDSYMESQKANPERYSVFTKNWQYTKWNSGPAEAGDNALVNITALNKNGEINDITNVWTDWCEATVAPLTISSFCTFNQEYVPEEWEDTVYLFNTGAAASTTYNTPKPYLVELKDGEFSRKIDIWTGTNGLQAQGYTPNAACVSYSHYTALTGGKGLRNKDIQRICITTFNVASVGGTWAIIIGGDKNSNVTDPFDPTKCIYVPLPSNAYYGYSCMAATDSAWYLQENATKRLIRITPDGQVSEITLTEGCVSCGFNYIEYTDKNNRPACAYYIHNTTSGGGHYVVFLEEEEGGQVNFIERKVTSGAYTPSGGAWYAQLFKFCENTNYIFFTADCGLSPGGNTDYGAAAMKNMVWYWDKKTHTTHAINNFYDGITFGTQDFIEMHKTRENAIWFPYIIQDFAAAKRTGEIHYISDVDYTNINEETGVDEGEIEVQSSTVGTNHGFFTVSSTANLSGTYYTHPLQGSPSWANGGARNQLSATNDDGILCIMSGDNTAYALCYGDGNIKVYEQCNHDGTSGGRWDCDAGKVPILPEEPYYGTSWHAGHQCLIGLTHGWALMVYPGGTVDMYDYDAIQYRSYTYIGVQYRNGEPTILVEPHLSKICRNSAVYSPQRIKFEKYSYLQTYDDYERRKKVLGEIRNDIPYSVGGMGLDCYFKEVRKETKKLNLTYDGTVISSVIE